MFGLSLQLMGYGLAGVFAALALLFGAVKLMMFLFPEKGGEE